MTFSFDLYDFDPQHDDNNKELALVEVVDEALVVSDSGLRAQACSFTFINYEDIDEWDCALNVLTSVGLITVYEYSGGDYEDKSIEVTVDPLTRMKPKTIYTGLLTSLETAFYDRGLFTELGVLTAFDLLRGRALVAKEDVVVGDLDWLYED